MSTNIKDHDHITQLIQLYIEGAAGDDGNRGAAHNWPANLACH